MMDLFDYDVIIIGGGPAGCSCALYTSRSSLKTLILDKNPGAGALAITHKIANYPGVKTSISGLNLLEMMREQAIQYGAEYKVAQVYGVQLDEDYKSVFTPDGVYRGKVLVLATGAMAREKTFEGEEAYLGRGISYCATCDAAFFKQQDVAVYGSNQESIDESLVLAKLVKQLYWIQPSKPSNKLNNIDTLTDKANVSVLKRTSLVSIQGNSEGIESLMLYEKSNSRKFELSIDGAFIYADGTKPIIDFLHGQIPLDQFGGVKTDAELKTEMDGVWAIGDIRNTPFKQAVVASSDGCIAAMSIDKYLNTRTDFKVDWVHR